MIGHSERSVSQQQGNKHKRGRRREPLKVELNVVVRTGEDPEDLVTIIDHREVPMIGSIFTQRDRIMRFSIGMIWRVVAKSPAAYREIVPGLFQYLNLTGRSKRR